MTTEPSLLAGSLRLVGGFCLALAGWLVVLAALAFATPIGGKIAVVAPPDTAVATVVAAGGRLLSANGMVVIARFDQPGFVRRLYAEGAMLVIDARDAGGCSGLAQIGGVLRRWRGS